MACEELLCESMLSEPEWNIVGDLGSFDGLLTYGSPTRRPPLTVLVWGYWMTSPVFISLKGRRYAYFTLAFYSSAHWLFVDPTPTGDFSLS